MDVNMSINASFFKKNDGRYECIERAIVSIDCLKSYLSYNFVAS